jgi:hypothetical protein
MIRAALSAAIARLRRRPPTTFSRALALHMIAATYQQGALR